MDAENLYVNTFTVNMMCGCDERNFWERRHESWWEVPLHCDSLEGEE